MCNSLVMASEIPQERCHSDSPRDSSRHRDGKRTPTTTDFPRALPGREDRRRIAHPNAASLCGFKRPPSGAGVQAAPRFQQQS
jgi:hypothetical protein